ncbi:uncharacterized protein N7482_009969 [Penicillium canariense]|uniref:C2H2-type domain-containing protein n=1 Tax=Penicillium canariense TaxID=189055 RepID=A0A9W9HPR2_9EURO|nr:uncharacterized protein N7482_009969 [Penicillium canariense]KAJ5153491.1 hypothetical protein N7482_009969 [Penicillium canariense]
MSPRTSNDPERVSHSQPRQTPMVSGMSNMASRSFQDDNLSSPGNSSLCSLHTSHGNPQDMKDWTLNTSESLDQAMSSKESPHVQLLSFSLSQQLMTPTVGPNDVMYAGVDFPAVSDLHDHNEMPRDFYSFVDLSSMDNDVCVQTGTPDDALSVAHSSHTEDGQLITAPETWNAMMSDGQYPGTTLDQLSSNHAGLSPLTEASNDIPITSACSHSGFPSFLAADDTFLGDFTTSPIGNPVINPAEPLFPNTAPLSEKDPNRTIRPSKQSRRTTLSGAQSQVKAESEFFPQVKTEAEFFPSLPVREPTRQRSKDSVEARNPRDHHYYHLAPQNDGKYHCPFSVGEKPCSHPPTTQKCAYQQDPKANRLTYSKYLDSHLKPYRCKHVSCVDNQLRFSSNACLFRHEREAHGMHGHGECPHLCLFEGCERSVPGFGFPRRWNLHDHMKRVHDYTSSDRHSSPEASPPGIPAKKKDPSSNRKRRGVTGATPAPTMKRTRSVHSQTGLAKASQATAHNGQRLQNAERNYYKCRARLVDELAKITPQDTSMHEKVNASLQELYTLGLQYRHLEAGHAVSQMPNGLPA